MRTYRRLCVQLTQRDREKIDGVLSGGIQPTRVVLRALVLTQLHNGQPVSQVAANVRLASKTVHDIGQRYQDGDLDRALYDKQRPGATELLDKSQKQRIIVLLLHHDLKPWREKNVVRGGTR